MKNLINKKNNYLYCLFCNNNLKISMGPDCDYCYCNVCKIDFELIDKQIDNQFINIETDLDAIKYYLYSDTDFEFVYYDSIKELKISNYYLFGDNDVKIIYNKPPNNEEITKLFTKYNKIINIL